MLLEILHEGLVFVREVGVIGQGVLVRISMEFLEDDLIADRESDDGS
jgi:hypothetical protein